jgi:hypothetical protein
MTSIWKLIYDLDYWCYIGTGGDIVSAKENRKEYLPLVNECLVLKVPPEQIPGRVLIELKKQAELPFYKRPMFWYLFKLWIKGLF